MTQKKTIFPAIALLVLVGSIFLSLRRSVTIENPPGEIRHFSQDTLRAKLRIKNGLTIEEFIDQHILMGNRIKAYTSHQMNSSKKQNRAITVSQEKKSDHNVSASHSVSRETNSTKPLYEPGVKLVHEVTWGDSLAQVARQYKTSVYKIAQLNRLSEKSLLKIGQKLQVIPEQPSTYRVRPGDNLSLIARRFSVDRQAIEQLNHLDASRPIWVGQRLNLPTEQKKIDIILVQIEKKKKEAAERKRHYQRRLLTRIEEQKRQRRREEARARERKKAQAERERRSRLARARKELKTSSKFNYKHKMRVIATAYTSHRSQTDSTPFLAAWNNRIRPGMKIIAVSPDLIRKYGITNGVRVKIGGLPGTYVVRDKMNPRLHDHIDIYMGTNRRRALRWGRRRVVLYW